MPHFKDGTEAKVGDIVKGKGYNVPHEIVGAVTRVAPGPTCNLTVACVAKGSLFSVACDPSGRPGEFAMPMPSVILEYGQADAFEKIG